MKNLIILLTVLGIFAGVFAYVLSQEEETTPCSALGYPGRCYSVAQEACQLMWDKAHSECELYVDGLDLSPGRLTGPIVQKCKLAKFNSAFAGSRTSDPTCAEKHRELEEWIRSNDFK